MGDKWMGSHALEWKARKPTAWLEIKYIFTVLDHSERNGCRDYKERAWWNNCRGLKNPQR